MGASYSVYPSQTHVAVTFETTGVVKTGLAVNGTPV
jgi:hypothetical protein